MRIFMAGHCPFTKGKKGVQKFRGNACGVEDQSSKYMRAYAESRLTTTGV
jgi:hypothetical protein